MNPNQHGFRSGFSCLSQLLQHFDHVKKLLEEGQNIDVIYLDFEKAFDKLDFEITLQKLQELGVSGKILDWIRSFLSQRKQCVVVEGVKSGQEPVLSGVPQGSVVGPLLFIVMLRDIDRGVSSAWVSSFADDTRVLAGVSTVEGVVALQEDLEKIYQWAAQNNATFNSTKFECLRYGRNKSLINSSKYYSNTLTEIESKPSVRDLGVTMSADGSFADQISNVTTSANLKCWWILRSFITRDRMPLVTQWKSLVQPILEYCCQLWCPNSPGLIQKLEKVQLNYFRKISGMSDLDYWDQLKRLNMYSLQRR